MFYRLFLCRYLCLIEIAVKCTARYEERRNAKDGWVCVPVSFFILYLFLTGKVEISKSFKFFSRREDRFRESGSKTEKNKTAHGWSFGLHRVENPEFDVQNKL
jgi:hypothetical protein